jgi:hypothetical protein
MAGFSERVNGTLGFIKGGEFLEKLSICQLHKKQYFPWIVFI